MYKYLPLILALLLSTVGVILGIISIYLCNDTTKDCSNKTWKSILDSFGPHFLFSRIRWYIISNSIWYLVYFVNIRDNKKLVHI